MNRQEMSPDLGARIAEMSFICACLIVVNHVGNVPRVLLYLCEVALPFFFAISGFLLARHIGERANVLARIVVGGRI